MSFCMPRLPELLCREQNERLCSMSERRRLVSPSIVARPSVAWPTCDRHRHVVIFKEKDNHAGCSQQEDYLQCAITLHNVASRPAKVGDKLVTTKFRLSHAGFRGHRRT